jgi:hypothetical protein
MQSFRLFSTDDRDIMALQANMRDFANDITALNILNYVLIRDINLVTGQINKINHKLNRNIIGYYVVRKNVAADIWDEQNQNNLPKSTLDLQTNADCKISLIIF